MTNSSAYWDSYIVANKKLIQHLIYQRCPTQAELREDVLSHVWEKLLEDDRRRLKLFDPQRGGSRLTYFRTVVNRLITGYFQSRFGRFRPPKALLRQNDYLLIRIYKYLCFERMRLPDLINYLKSVVPGKVKQAHIENKVDFILEHYPGCGEVREDAVDVDETKLGSTDPSQENHMISAHWADLFQLIVNPDISFKTDKTVQPMHQSEMERIREKLRLHFTISPEKRLFLRMIYQDGMSIASAGRQLGWNKNQATGHHRRLILQLRSLLEGCF